MPDILLIQPPVRDFYFTAKRSIPYGLACIAASLIRAGFSTDIFDALATAKSRITPLPDELSYLTEYYGKADISPFALFHHFRHFGYSFEHIGKMARESGAFLVGISSLFTAYSNEAIRTAQVVRKFHPNCQIVLGGHHPTALPEAAMECDAVDFVIRGEGEVSMPMLASAVLNSGTPDFASIPGIVFRRKDDSLHISEPAMMEDLGDYPPPATHLIRHVFYQRKKRGSAVIVSSRGCPMKCTYCSVGASSLTYRRRSVASVIQEIDHAVTRYDAGFLDFEDENLSLNRKWFMELLYEIRTRFSESKLELRAMNGLFPPSLDEEMIQMMKAAGFKTLNLSLGSTSADQLRKFQRPDVRNAVDRVISIAEKHGLEVVCYVIAGAPGQKAEDSLRDLLWFARTRVLAGISVFYPSPGSADFENAAKQGILPPHFSMMRSSALPISHTTTRLESLTILRLGRILNFMKSLGKIPDPSPFAEKHIPDICDRKEIGRHLISGFLHDAKIRGLTPDGDIFEHKVSGGLARGFAESLRNGLPLF